MADISWLEQWNHNPRVIREHGFKPADLQILSELNTKRNNLNPLKFKLYLKLIQTCPLYDIRNIN